jgi:hypothetical protein
MNKDLSFGLLPFYKSTRDRDWQLKGYYRNWALAINYVPIDSLVSFKTPVYTGNNEAPSTMKIRRVKVVDNEISVVSQSTVTSGLSRKTEVINGETLTYYYRQQANLDTTLTEGYIYDIYIEDSDGNTFVSDIFVGLSLTDLQYYTEGGVGMISEDGTELILE